MPRAFDSDQPGARLEFTELVDCPSCDATIEGWFTDDSMSFQDMTDPPTGVQVCDACGHAWRATAAGWQFYSEPG